MSRTNEEFERSVQSLSGSAVSRAAVLFRFRILTTAYWVFLTLLLWLPDPRVLLWGWEPAEGPRGYAHVITFSLLGLLVELGRRKKSFLFWAGILIGYTFLTEIVQEMLPIRSFDWGDVAQDLIGSFLGMGIGVLIRRVWLAVFPYQPEPPVQGDLETPTDINISPR